MSDIYLKSLKDQHISKNFELDLLRMDVDHNQKLEEADFRQVYGNSFKKEDHAKLQKLVKQNNVTAYRHLLKRLSNNRHHQLTFLVKQKMTDQRTHLLANGFDIDRKFSIPPNYDHKISDRNVQKRETMADMLTPYFMEVYQQHMGKKTDPVLIKNAITFSLASYQPIAISQLADDVFKFIISKEDNDKKYDQEEYAQTQYNEFRQSDRLSALESKFNIDIRLSGTPLNADQISILHDVLKEIKDRRPQDFALLKTLHFEELNRRGSAFVTATDKISMWGAFANYGEGKIPGYYAQESQWAAENLPTKDYIFQLLLHELGHLVAERDDPTRENFNVPTKYEKLAPQNAHEWFAEDYGLFIQSNGKKIMKRTIDGQNVPNYHERLKFFQEHYPLAN